MYSFAYGENNPFFKYDLDKLCAICNRNISTSTITETFTLNEKVTAFEDDITVLEVLQKISNFGNYNVDDGPQNICKTCYDNTLGAYKFINICNNSVANIISYLDRQNEMQCNAESEVVLELSVIETSAEIVAENTEEGMDNTQDVLHTIGEEQDNESQITNEIKYADDLQTNDCNKLKVQCKVCHKWYDNTDIKMHQRFHRIQKSYRCKFCGKGFLNRSYGRRHEGLHFAEPKYSCDICGKTFKLKANLKNHEKCHDTERPFECHICNKTFRTNTLLKNHHKTHSEKKEFHCTICLKGFHFKKHVDQHMVTHTGEKNYKCKVCDRRFAFAHSLKGHILTHSKGGNE